MTGRHRATNHSGRPVHPRERSWSFEWPEKDLLYEVAFVCAMLIFAMIGIVGLVVRLSS